MTILVLNGPNLNRLGKRQPEIYGSETLEDIEKRMRAAAGQEDIIFFQSNHEGELIDHVHRAADEGWPVIINPGGFTHTSVALRDALAEVADGAGFVEVHLSNVHARESFRQHSYLSPIARGVIAGLGSYGYIAALRYFVAD
ncbi:type II 3-dehydroquinate dehydratase [Corynebacterium minutissimum]|uniref:3-dehydroquinate dehydratase n=1 Tax=Corynebacterium minutissimum TaxID=38301 RepID=A0A2X4RLH7_9CORY|nr:type II 3-dehydroquinate dehydratase [Corynebacterium minutissimum]KHO29307.1 3-dehydroquinate dehydratase [Corynebacterium minutissimum]QPS59016.1 type II 3-dehydroquinate dehydratase [Corynebacterium minutissimum]QQA80194.1 type II 3-dehydroquinate dehydratase [Corynebacterium minutissimum]SQH99828.1 3-dehydroquinate dehydratase [Corynebacterium minutissimum]VEG06105.1 3-dehydroquinate dehydratase [Corynebacterium minutissimum]